MSALQNEKELHSACKSGDIEIVKFLLEANTRATTFAANGYSPLIVAASRGHSKCVELLLQMGKGVRVDMETKSSGETALSVVCGTYRSKTILLDGQSSEQYASNDRARENRNQQLLEVLHTLLNHNADMASAKRMGATPLHIASMRGFCGAVELLLPCFYIDKEQRRIDVSVHYTDSANRTPLHLACINGHVDVASVLLHWGADPIAQDKTGASCLHNAIFQRFHDVVRVIFCSYPTSHNGGYEERSKRLKRIQLDVKRNILVPVSQMGKKTAPQQSALAAAQDNAQLVDIILRGPDCLLDVIQYEINSRPEMIIANRKKRKEKRKRRRKQRKQREMRKRLGMSSMDFSGNAVLSGVNWEEEEPEPKSKPEPHWLYQDGHENIIGPVSSSKMREWYQKGKLPLELLVYKIPEHEGSALTNEPPPPSSLNMPARGQGPYADPSFGRWDPIKHPHSQRHQNMRGKFQYLRVILKNHGGPANTFGTPTNFSTMMMTKLMASKWKKKSKGSKKHLKPGEYDSDESSGIEDSEPQMSYEEMEQERMEQEAMQLLIHQETEAHWVGPHFVQERDPITQRTPLATACHNGWYDTCQFLLESGKCKLDAKGKYGYTPLNLASKNGHTDVVRYLLSDPKGKESISIKDNSYHWTPLVWAAGKGHLEITKLLLEAGADPENYREEKRWWQAGALGVASSKRGNEWVVKELIKAGADVNRVGGESGRITALHAAAAQGNAHVVDAILATGRCDTEVRDGNTATALMLACRGGHVRCARLLMDRGCNYRNQTQGGWTGLMYASEGGFDKIVYRMLHWKKKKRTVDGIDTINIPQSNNSSVPKLPSISGMASMGIAKLAAKRVHERATQAVVDRNNGSAPTTQHFMGIAYTPSKKNDTSIHVNKSNNSNGRNSNSSSGKKNSVKNYTFFNTQGSKLSRHKLELVCSQESHTSCNALHLATRFGHVKVLKHLLKCKLPLEIIDAKSGTLQTPLGIACCFGHIDCVEQLLKYGAAVEQRQCDEVYGLTPLMLAAAHGHVQIVRELLKIADTEVLDSKNRNAGMIAAANGHKEVFQFISAERKIRERKLAAIRLAEYERVEAIEKAEKAAKEARRQKEQDFKDAALRENRRMAKEKLRLEEEADASRKNKRRKKKKKKKGKGKKKKNQKKQKEKAKRQKKSKKKSKK